MGILIFNVGFVLYIYIYPILFNILYKLKMFSCYIRNSTKLMKLVRNAFPLIFVIIISIKYNENDRNISQR